MCVNKEETTGIIFNIERHSTEDGPGIRTVVFLKGCPLRCEWCSNPESQSFKPEILYFSNKCTLCGHCIKVCPHNAISYSEKFGLLTDYTKCDVCGKCVDACYYGAREVSGREMRVSEIVTEVKKDLKFYRMSGGGVTFSGGEPLSQPVFLHDLICSLKAEGINTAVETTLFASRDTVISGLECADLVFVDLKHIDSSIHKKYTGVDNAVILENIKLLDEMNKSFIIRIPFIPGFNDDNETQKSIYSWASRLKNMMWIEILPYHRLALYKYRGLGRNYKLADMEPVKKESLSYLTEMGSRLGVKVRIGAS
jgi:pyruvate formate lyase activating enzyme